MKWTILGSGTVLTGMVTVTIAFPSPDAGESVNSALSLTAVHGTSAVTEKDASVWSARTSMVSVLTENLL